MRLHVRAEDETATFASTRNGTMQAFRDQLPFTHVFIVLEPPHTHTHTREIFAECYLLQQLSGPHNAPLSWLTCPFVSRVRTRAQTDLNTNTQAPHVHAHNLVILSLSSQMFLHLFLFAVQNFSSDVMDSPASGLPLNWEKCLLIRDTETSHHVEVVLSR